MNRLGLACALATILYSGAPASAANTIIVTNGGDSGDGSLRAAIASANDVDTINFWRWNWTASSTKASKRISQPVALSGKLRIA